MSEHYTRNTVSVSAWCPRCGKSTMHRVDDRRRGPCLECMKPPAQATTTEQTAGQITFPTGCFFCPECRKETIHRMDAGGWKKGPCLTCEARAAQSSLFDTGA